MMRKLAFRNVKRSARDYMVYFMTMAVVPGADGAGGKRADRSLCRKPF